MSSEDSSTIFQRLEAADGQARTDLFLGFVDGTARLRINPESLDGQALMLDGIDVGGESLSARSSISSLLTEIWNPAIQGLDLHEAQLSGASMRAANFARADLRGAHLGNVRAGSADFSAACMDGADLHEADLVNANFQGAHLAEAVLQDALLEDASLVGAHLRFANLQSAVLEGADIQGADLWSAVLDGASLTHANLRGATLREASMREADLSGTDLRQVDLTGSILHHARMRGCDLRDATLTNANLSGADLRGSQLQNVDMSSCNLEHIHLAHARLDRTWISRDQLGDVLGEELESDFVEASAGYLALERNFIQLGDSDAASWAYRRRRRMQKQAAREQALQGLARGEWRISLRASIMYIADQFVEWLCDYGESISRVMRAIVAVYTTFMLLYGLTHSVVRVTAMATQQKVESTNSVMDLAIFSLLALTTSGSPVVGLLPRSESVHFLTGIEALCGIFLTGLLGFVVGNRIRR